MSSAIISFLIAHILTFVESELAKEEPAIMEALTHDIQSLIIKLESLISAKSEPIASVVNPVLNAVSVVAIEAANAAGAVVAANS